MKLSTTTQDFTRYGISISQALDYLAQTPFRHADFGFERETTDDSFEQNAALFAAKAEAYGIRFMQAHGISLDPFKRDRDAELLVAERTLAVCAKLGIPHVVFHALFCGEEQYPAGKEQFFEQNKAFYSLLLPMAEHYGVTLLAENSVELHSKGRYYFMTGKDLAEFVDFVDHPFMGAVWDVGHANIRKNDQYQDILTLGDRLKAVHIHDNLGHGDAHLAPFLGNADFDAVIRALRDVDFKGVFSFEADNCPPLRRDTPIRPTPELQIVYDTALFATGKQMLECYGLFEE